MKHKTRTFLLWLIPVLVLGFFLVPNPKKIGVEDKQKSADVSVVKKEIKEDTAPYYSLDVEYPELQGGDAAVTQRVNADIKAAVERNISAYKQNAGPAPAELGDVKGILTVRYEVAYLTESIFSTKLDFSGYVAGAAHPDNYVETFTYDLRSGKKAALKDLFLPNADYLQTISAYAIPQLAADLKISSKDTENMDWIKQGAAPKEANYSNFLIAKDGFTIIFDTYQVAPGAAGERRVSVPYALLERLMDPAGLLGIRAGARL